MLSIADQIYHERQVSEGLALMARHIDRGCSRSVRGMYAILRGRLDDAAAAGIEVAELPPLSELLAAAQTNSPCSCPACRVLATR